MIDYEKIKLEIEDRFKDIDNAIARLRALLDPDPEDKPETWEQKHIKSVLESRRGDRCRQHESDGEDYRYQRAHHYKCTKCGEFYR